MQRGIKTKWLTLWEMWISLQTKCPYGMKNWTEGFGYFDCGTCLVPTDATHKIKQREIRRIDTHFIIKKGGSRGVRHGDYEEQRAYDKAHQCSSKARKKKFNSILHRFQTCEICRNSQMHIGWIDLDEFAPDDHSYARRVVEINFEQPTRCKTNAVTSWLS